MSWLLSLCYDRWPTVLSYFHSLSLAYRLTKRSTHVHSRGSAMGRTGLLVAPRSLSPDAIKANS